MSKFLEALDKAMSAERERVAEEHYAKVEADEKSRAADEKRREDRMLNAVDGLVTELRRLNDSLTSIRLEGIRRL